MSVENVDIDCEDGHDSRCVGTLEIQVDFDDLDEDESLYDYAERTGQDTICGPCGSDNPYPKYEDD